MVGSRNREALLRGGVALAAVATLLLSPAVGLAADSAGPASAGKSPAVTVQSIPGSTVKRVVLSAKAAERLDIQTGTVGEEAIVRKQMVSGLVVPPLEKQSDAKVRSGGPSGFGKRAAAPPPPVAAPATSPAAGKVWVLIMLSPGEWNRLAKDKPARLLPLATRDKLGKEVWALPSGRAPLEDARSSMLALHYVVPGKDSGLTPNERIRVELQLSGSIEKQKVAPYSAVYYDAKGAAWVYVNTKPLAFERQRIVVERVAGDLAVLSDGPPVGTAVVTVGAALLYGAEIFGK